MVDRNEPLIAAIREAMSHPRETVAAFLVLIACIAAGIALYIVLWGALQ
jgi:hypothetical protein